MATTDAAMAEAPPHRPDRRLNGSPAPTQSKRDKRRNMLTERLAVLSEKFGKDRDQAFREQLQKIQIDTNLVMRMDPYVDRPMDGFEEDERRLQQLNGDSENGSGPRTLLEMAGPHFSQWMEKVQDLVEQRDYALTKYKFDYEKKTSEYLATHAYKVETANREYRSLSQTLRDRLINAITTKKFRLNKEKEALEIESPALLLHPNQFSVANPASPGGTHSKRATRLRREVEEIPSIDGKKRKRGHNDDDGSPAPQRRALDPSTTTPLWQNDRLAMRKVEGPVYSIDKLFTDKELSMTYNTAAVAAHKHMLTHKPKFDEHGVPLAFSEGSGSDVGEHWDDDVPYYAPAMERNVSHATRSGRAGANNPNFTDDKLMGLEALANFDFPGNFERMLGADPKLPPTFPSTYVKGHAKGTEFNGPSALNVDDVNGDWKVMQALRHYDQIHGVGSNFAAENGSRKLLEAASMPVRDQRFVSYLQGERPAENEVRKRLGLPAVPEPNHGADQGGAHEGVPSKLGRSGTPAQQSPAKGVVAPVGGVPLSRQNSANGAPMSRSSSRKGRPTRGG
ncbi:Sds3-like-domain-containing protein [Lasiosphaeria miniovina]|uniref:Sds3-like-domain-containing protein n=1 Tax=Lasiosphaeria miniovina TaxID=1954250 RepID=A0AA39ZZK9_9PEZI|nr:Sds3-like-domain-containing protein [Lasiosphaeria miniovina]KAK0706542.1 Sds3-like-domain-containing protein [Lasiosphaeria miniovina]